MTQACVLGHPMSEGQVRCETCGFGAVPAAAPAEAGQVPPVSQMPPPQAGAPATHASEGQPPVRPSPPLTAPPGPPPGWYVRNEMPAYWDGLSWSTPVQPPASTHAGPLHPPPSPVQGAPVVRSTVGARLAATSTRTRVLAGTGLVLAALIVIGGGSADESPGSPDGDTGFYEPDYYSETNDLIENHGIKPR